MIFDELDKKIIGVLYEEYCSNPKRKISTYYIAKKIFGDKDKYGLIKKNNLVSSRVRRLAKIGIVENEKIENRKYYKIVDKLIIGDATITVKFKNRKDKLNLGKGVLIMYDDSYIFFTF